MHRFLHPVYVFKSIKKKRKEKTLEKKFSPLSPYGQYKTKLKQADLPLITPKYIDEYIAFDYFSYENCIKYYRNIKNDSVVEMIKALVFWNTNGNKEEYLKMTDDIIKKGTHHKDHFIFFLHNDMGDRYDIPDEYTCGVAQGKGTSLLLRAYLSSKDEKYLNLCRGVINSYFLSVEENGMYRQLNEGLEWVEEYPDLKSPSMVLNGHIFAIIALGEYLSFFNDIKYNKLYQSLIKSTLTYLPAYITDHGLLYELGRWKLCNVHYYGIMTSLFNHIYQQTRVQEFLDMRNFLNDNCDWKLFRFLMNH